MKLSIFPPVVAVLITGCFALPALLPTPTHVSVSQDPSPPRPFPAGRIVEVNDPSPPRPFPKYALEGGSPLEERDPSALSRFPTDGENEAHDPSPPRPFPAGRIVEVKYPSPPLEERDPSAPHKLVEIYTAASDPSPPRPFPKYPLDGGNPLEERDPLSRFPTGEEKEAADPSPPRPFPAGRVIEVKEPSPSDTIGPRSPSPLLRTAEGSAAEANDPSPPRPFPAGRVVEVKDASPSDTVEPRSPSPLLRTTGGSEAEANDPSPPRPFPAGQPVDIDPRGEDPQLPPHRGHGGYFPPSNPPVSDPTAPAMEADRANADPDPDCARGKCPLNRPDCCRPHPQHGPPNTPSRIPRPASPTPTARDQGYPIPPHHHPCTATITSFRHFRPLNGPGAASTAYGATVTLPHELDCGACRALTVTTVHIGNGPAVRTSGPAPTVTVSATTTEYVPVCSPFVLL